MIYFYAGWDYSALLPSVQLKVGPLYFYAAMTLPRRLKLMTHGQWVAWTGRPFEFYRWRWERRFDMGWRA